MKRVIFLFLLLIFFNEVYSQKWIVKDSILVFPQGFSSWLKKNNGGIDSTGKIGTNQGVEVFDFNKDGMQDLLFQLGPSNDVTREYLKGLFIQNDNEKYILDTNYIIKGKGDMWYGGFGDFNGDGLNDYHYITQNYHGVDSNRKYSPEMVNNNWPDRVFINNKKGFDTLSLDFNNIEILSSYVADVDNDGADEIICTSRDAQAPLVVYKYDKTNKNFIKINSELTSKWMSIFNYRNSSTPIFNLSGSNDKNKFSLILGNNCQGGGAAPYCYTNFTIINYSFTDSSLSQINLNRDEWVIPIKYSQADTIDTYKFNLPEIAGAYKIDIDKNGEEEVVTGGFYMTDYSRGKQRFAYGWKVLGLNGKDLTTQFFKDSGFDKNVELITLGLDIDENTDGIEMIPGSWGGDGNGGSNIGTVGYYYRVVNNKFEKYFIKNLKLESGKILDSTYFKQMQLVKYQNFKKNKNALIIYDINDIKRTAIIYQASCDNKIKPIFNTTKYSICSGDTLSISVTNINKGDTIKWYYGSKSDLTNVSNKKFTDSGKVFVTRTDTLGCVISSDTVSLIIYSIPSSPNLTRDSSNFIVSSTNVINWYKDGTVIPDTTQKIKPTSPGSYTAKTIQNGCVSALSIPYYYLVTDVINLSKDEFIKLAPNPFTSHFNLDFVVKGYQSLNLEVFDIASGSRLASKQNLISGTSIYLNHLSAGTYLIKITSNDNKMFFQFKMIKL